MFKLDNRYDKGYMNIKTELVHDCLFILTQYLKNKEIKAEWAKIAVDEGYDSYKDWLLKEIELCEYELETRKRYGVQ